PGSLITEKVVRTVEVDGAGYYAAGETHAVSKLAVIERHRATGNIGLGLVEGYDVNGGAVATTIAHDSHNLIVIGDNDHDMLIAASELIRCSGGMTLAKGGDILGTLPLPIAGLMSNEPGEEISARLARLNRLAHDELGVHREIDPFMSLSFLALPVIPDIKLTDMGLFDVGRFEFMDIEAE
ncbi:MAG: adenine deaminase, partial [Spirochaetales bacterium]|nr:adenine deaminase [Spirochaetales bacterium]